MVDGPKGGLFAAKGTWLTTVVAGPSEVACDDDEAAESAAEAKGGAARRKKPCRFKLLFHENLKKKVR